MGYHLDDLYFEPFSTEEEQAVAEYVREAKSMGIATTSYLARTSFRQGMEWNTCARGATAGSAVWPKPWRTPCGRRPHKSSR